jgi:hypothetical protein
MNFHAFSLREILRQGNDRSGWIKRISLAGVKPKGSYSPRISDADHRGVAAGVVPAAPVEYHPRIVLI